MANIKLSSVDDRLSGEEVTVQGVIDLLAVSARDIIIVDYKTNDASINTLKAKYLTQMKIYTMAVAKALGLPVRAYLYSFRDGVLAEM